jgi:predicted metal-dependent peptidase
MGLERYIDEIKKSQINWKVLLQKMIQATIPRDYSWLKKAKKSVATGTYLPSVVKEKIDVCIGIDLSGSIGKEELTEFMSEVIGMAKAYQNSITMRLLTHDVEVHNDYEIRNGNIEKIKALKLTGGGGTSHIPIFDYVKEKVKDCKLVVFFTDGYSDLEHIDFGNYEWKKIIVINKTGDSECVQNKDCVVIKMRENGSE